MPRKVRIATVAQLNEGGPTVDDNRERMRGLIEQAAAEKPDIICLPETFLELNVEFDELSQVAELVPGPTTDMAATYAEQHNCYIICPLTTVHGERYMNESVLINRDGAIAGSYAKIHPVVEGAAFASLEKGITPGSEPKVFATDFGRIGMQICFDINWPQTWAELKRRGAEIVFWSSAYDGGKHLGIHAWNQHYYVVSAVKSRYARIIDVMGEMRAMTGTHDPIIARTIDLDVGIFHCDFNRSQIPLIRAKYGPDVTFKVWHQEGIFTLQSNREGLSVADIEEEFLLDPLEVYLARNTRLQDAWRAGEPVPDLTPRYVGREQWS
jgi:predicted amidohydrolase